MLKPKVGDYYKLYPTNGIDLYNIIQISRVDGNIAFYKSIHSGREQPWDFNRFGEILEYKLTPLEIELL